GQTYSRKVDSYVLNVLAGIAQSAAKMATDIRLLAHMKEFDEPFEKNQIGSSAMAYKRNPMRCERVVSLSRYIMNDAKNAADTAAAQWLERTLDDSANRRISIPEAFLACDAVLTLCTNVIKGGTVYPKVMEKHLMEELPFIASENILMDAVKRGGDRQELHEAIRLYSQKAAAHVKLEGGDNDLLQSLMADERFGLTEESVKEVLDIRKFVGCAPSQTEAFLRDWAAPVIEKYSSLLGEDEEIRV
ncbi:MAG: adenylosuccinate lyase, partial [Oscillospiraceae bacterium]|nr:adenylosuccinate lyase [Oscillospiraceae bacterium]